MSVAGQLTQQDPLAVPEVGDENPVLEDQSDQRAGANVGCLGVGFEPSGLELLEVGLDLGENRQDPLSDGLVGWVLAALPELLFHGLHHHLGHVLRL